MYILDGLIWLSVLPEIILALALLGSKVYLDKRNVKLLEENQKKKNENDNSCNHESIEDHSLDLKETSTIASSSKNSSIVNRGYQISYDYQGLIILDNEELDDFSDFVADIIAEKISFCKFRVLDRIVSVNNPEVSSPGFNAFFLFYGGHISVHHDGQVGVMTLDILTSEESWDLTKQLAKEIHEEIMHKYPHCDSRVVHSRRCPFVSPAASFQSAVSAFSMESFSVAH